MPSRSSILLVLALISAAGVCPAADDTARPPATGAVRRHDSSPAASGAVPRPDSVPPRATNERLPGQLPADQVQHRPLRPASHSAPVSGPRLTPRSVRPAPRAVGGWRSVFQLMFALAIVASLLAGLAWLLRRLVPRSNAGLPEEVLELLGRRPLVGRQQATVLRFGNKLLLLAVSPLGIETLAEITEPAEVERLASLCRQKPRGAQNNLFQQVLKQFEREPAEEGFVGQSQANTLKLAMRGLSAKPARGEERHE